MIFSSCSVACTVQTRKDVTATHIRGGFAILDLFISMNHHLLKVFLAIRMLKVAFIK